MQSNWYQSRTARRVKALLQEGFSYRYISDRCMVPRWRIVSVVVKQRCGVRGYRNGETDHAKETLRRIDLLLRDLRRVRA